MISCYVRSSSYGTFQLCQNKFLIEYVIGIKHPPNEKASMGSVFHKAAEIRGRLKLAVQNELDYVDCEDIGIYPISDVTIEFAIRKGFETYKELEMPHWTEKEFAIIRKWWYDFLAYGNGMYDPINQDIINVEQKFDFTIDKPWGKYKYELPEGKIIEGQLSVKGTIDLVARENDDTLMICDYKTGKRSDIITGKLKEVEDLEKDFQVNLYRYAVKRLFPEYKYIQFTMLYINDGGPFTVYETPTLEETEASIKHHFYKVRLADQPSLIDSNKKWFCKYTCKFYANNHAGTGKSTCQFFQDEVKKHGIKQVTSTHANLDIINSYMDGGGRQAKD